MTEEIRMAEFQFFVGFTEEPKASRQSVLILGAYLISTCYITSQRRDVFSWGTLLFCL